MKSNSERRARVALLLSAPILLAVISLLLGKKTGWDLFNYHWYNPFALLNGRFGFDVAVGHHATYYNPLPDVPMFLVGTYAPSWMVGVLLGTLAGVVVALLGAIAYQMLPQQNERRRLVISAVLALLGATGAGAWQEIGDPANDIPAAIGIFIALWLLISRFDLLLTNQWNRSSVSVLVVAGFFCGSAVGLKLTTAAYALGLVVALTAMRGSPRERLMRASIFGSGALIGVVVFGGFWMLKMWEFSGNPFFPYFNSLFQSPLVIADSYLDPSFHPHGFAERLLFPFLFTSDSHYVSETSFRDAHVATVYVLLPIVGLLALFKKTRNDNPVPLRQATFLFIFGGVSYFAWLLVFDVYRYLIPLEMLAPTLITCAVMLLRISMAARAIMTAITLVVLQLLVKVDLSDRQSWQGSYVHVDIPKLAAPDNTMILMTGHAPMSFVIPSFPRSVPFIRIDGWLVQGADQITGLAKEMHQRVAAHRGPLFLLFVPDESEAVVSAAEHYGLRVRMDESCTPITSNVEHVLRLCEVMRIGRIVRIN